MDADVLRQKLAQLDGKGYKAYRQIRGAYIFPRFTLFIDYVQGDPYAAPSRLRAAVSLPLAGFDPSLFANRSRRVALEDFLARAFDRAIAGQVKGHRGTGNSGQVAVDCGGQEILERTATVVTSQFVEVRFTAGLPASGRRCLGKEAAAMLLEEIPRVVDRSLYYNALDAEALDEHVRSAEDQDWLRGSLGAMGLVAFIGDGSVLPRGSGISDAPLASGHIVEFAAPPELRVEVELPNRGRVAGMGIPAGVTLIVGGGYHGKSTLLAAVQRGVYNHIPGDGRELVATRGDAVKIRAEDGRRVEKVDIEPFISNLPFGVDTHSFSTENASGSTSQAANIVESLEAGSRLLLIDEDTSATNFMIRDELMQRLISKDKEPITPFIDQVRNLKQEHGVSTMLVMGGSGDYFDVADQVIAMENYQPRIVTQAAREVVAARKDVRLIEAGGAFGPLVPRAPLPEGINPRRGRKEKVSTRDCCHIQFGNESVDLSAVEQLVDISQMRAIGDLVWYGLRQGYFDGRATLGEILDLLLEDLERESLDVISPYMNREEKDAPATVTARQAGALESMLAEVSGKHPGDYAMPRRYEVAAMLNRLRSLVVRQIKDGKSPNDK